MSVFSPRLDAALQFAAIAHRNQKRKGQDVPYIVHPFYVAMILQQYGFSEDVVIAGLLHDVVEDTSTSLDEIQTRFGEQVAWIVGQMTEVEYSRKESLTWEEKRAISLAHLREGHPDVGAVKVADVLHNAASRLIEIQQGGVETWAVFSRGALETINFYRQVLAGAEQTLGSHPIVAELRDTIDAVEVASNLPPSS